MQIILLEKHKKLGDVGDIANVKGGFARNFLIPNKKAIQATKENKEVFKQKKDVLYKELEKKKAHAEKINSKLEDKWVYIVKQAGKDGRLYGSVSSIDIMSAIGGQLKQELSKSNIQLLTPIKYIGRHEVVVNIFADIVVRVNMIVSRTQEEAEVDLKNAIAGKPEAGKLEEEKAKAAAEAAIKTEEDVLEEEAQEVQESTDAKKAESTKKKSKSEDQKQESEEVSVADAPKAKESKTAASKKTTKKSKTDTDTETDTKSE